MAMHTNKLCALHNCHNSLRHLYRGDTVGTTALTAGHVACIVQRRARLAGLDGDWAAHSLRSGFVTEADR
jgi:hypothetical protein